MEWDLMPGQRVSDWQTESRIEPRAAVQLKVLSVFVIVPVTCRILGGSHQESRNQIRLSDTRS